MLKIYEYMRDQAKQLDSCAAWSARSGQMMALEAIANNMRRVANLLENNGVELPMPDPLAAIKTGL